MYMRETSFGLLAASAMLLTLAITYSAATVHPDIRWIWDSLWFGALVLSLLLFVMALWLRKQSKVEPTDGPNNPDETSSAIIGQELSVNPYAAPLHGPKLRQKPSDLRASI